MNKKLYPLLASGIVLLGIVGTYAISSNDGPKAGVTMTSPDLSASALSSDTLEKTPASLPTTEEKVPDQAMSDTSTANPAERYVSYSAQALSQAQGLKKVLFFHASWCPTCQAADRQFKTNPQDIPDNVVVIKTDYDTQQDLKTKYAITYQHTFVQIDGDGNELAKWNGGDIRALTDNLI